MEADPTGYWRKVDMNQRTENAHFRALHQRPGAFIIPNPWDVGTARILAALGFDDTINRLKAFEKKGITEFKFEVGARIHENQTFSEGGFTVGYDD